MQLRTVAIVLQTCFCIAIFYLIVFWIRGLNKYLLFCGAGAFLGKIWFFDVFGDEFSENCLNLVIRQCYLCYIDVAKFERCYKIFLAVRMRPWCWTDGKLCYKISTCCNILFELRCENADRWEPECRITGDWRDGLSVDTCPMVQYLFIAIKKCE